MRLSAEDALWEEPSQHTHTTDKHWLLWGTLLFLCECYTVCWMAFFAAFHNSWRDIDQALYVVGKLPVWDYSISFVCLFVALSVYCFSVALYYGRMHHRGGGEVRCWMVHRVVVVLILLFDVFATVTFYKVWHQGYGLIGRNMQSIVPLLQLVLVFLVSCGILPILSFGNFLWVRRKMFYFRTYLVAVVAVILFLYSIPLWFRSIQIVDTLPPKPKFIGHRGDPRHSPENTIPAFQRASEIEGIIGVEADLKISWDGVPFVMHDFTLWRTTNVRKVFPKRAKDRASTFTIDEIKQLDAGSHFSSKYKGVQVPTFEELLAFVTSKNLSLIFDLGPPTKDHPFFHTYVNVTVNIIKKMNAVHQVIWLIPDHLDDGSDGISFQEELLLLPQVHGIRIAVGVTRYSRYNLSPTQAKNANVSIVNAHGAMTDDVLKSYLEAGLHLNTYTINDRWLFSQMWCLGSNTVTTETYRDLTKMSRPSWRLTHSQYLILWTTVESVSFAAMCIQAIAYLRVHFKQTNHYKLVQFIEYKH